VIAQISAEGVTVAYHGHATTYGWSMVFRYRAGCYAMTEVWRPVR